MSWRLACVAAVLLGILAPPPATAQTERRIVTIEDADYFGFDLETVRDVTLEDCSQICLAQPECHAFTYNTNAGWCFLKSDYGELRSFVGAVAGRVVESQAQAEVLPRPDLSFLPGWATEQAERYAGEVRAGGGPGGNPAALAATGRGALQAGDAKSAADLLRRSLALAPQDGTVWLDLARAIPAIEPDEQTDSFRLQEQATGAAVGAVVNAATRADRAAAYGLLAEALVDRRVFRPALESYKAGLALVDDPAMRTAYDELHAEHGFRLVDHTVDADTASPRICVQFSESLMPGRVDFAPYVRLDGAAPAAVSAQGQQLCVEGVEHGGRYRVALRPGLPSAVDEVLESQINLDVYVRDRAPAVRFTGSAYVLPRVGARGIPIVSVNTGEVELELYRIGARGLAGVFADESFLSQLGDYDADRIAGETGEKLWKGTLDVRSELNEEVTTSIPLEEALPEREPGVYALRARAKEAQDEGWQPQATQWFVVSDIGLATLMGGDGLHVFARSLSTAGPMADVEVALVARNNEVLGKAVTDASGHVHFPVGLTRGTGGLAPGHLSARTEGVDFAVLDLTRAGFDLTDRGVDGRPAPGPIDLFLYTERGVYRPGETVHLTALVRDDGAAAIDDLPLTFVLTRPDGMEDRRIASTETAPGAHVLDLPMIDAAMRGTWRISAHAAPDGPSIARAEFLIEDFVPDRIEFDLTAEAEELPRDGAVEVSVDGRFLYGAPAADLALEGSIRIAPTDARPEAPGYRFGLDDEEALAVRQPLGELPPTDADGQASFDVAAPELPATTKPLQATISVAMREAGGRAVEETVTLPVIASRPMIGIRPAFGNAVDEGGTAEFDLIALDASGARADLAGARWQLYRIERDFQWYRADGEWSYEPVEYTTQVADGVANLSAADPVRIAAPVGWGRYRLEVSSPVDGGPVSSVDFTAGWYVATSDADSPDVLDVSLNRASYAVGDTARVTIGARFAGTALVNVVGESLIESREIEVGEDGATIELEVTEDWAPGAYVTATVFRPSDADAGRMPARAIGLAWLAVDSSERTLSVALELPEIAAPRENLSVPVSVAGLPAGETAWLTVAAVDVGILNLTDYEPPEPEGWYFGQRRLSMEMRDLYGSLIDGMLGETGRLRVGGGAPGGGLVGSPPTQEPVSLFTGPIEADADGNVTANFDIPEFNGTLRVMAVAWSPNAVGHGTADVTVRDPVVVTASIPRVLAPGDESRLRLDIHNMEGPAGAYLVSAKTSGHVEAGAPSAPTVTLAADARAAVDIPLTGAVAGDGQVTVRLAHENGLEISQTLNITVRPSEPPATDRRVVTLEPGESLTLDSGLVAGNVPGTTSVTLSVTDAGGLDLPAIIGALDRYPYGCAEQIASRAMPLLYLSEVAQETGIATGPEIEERIRDAIKGVTANQSSSGSFGLWGPGSGDMWLDAYVTDFLTRASSSGHEVPRIALQLALDNLSNQLAYTTDAADAGERIAYALYVLARNQRAAISDLRYYADAALDDFPTPLAKAQLGAALALYGEQGRAAEAFAAALADLQAPPPEDGGGRRDYGSRLRDGAATLTLAAEAGTDAAPLPALLTVVEDAREQSRWTSTQENAWMLLAAHALIGEGSDIALDIDSEPVEGNVTRRYDGDALSASPVTVANRSDRPVEAVVGVAGVPGAPRGAEANGFTIERDYYTLDGEPVDPSAVAQNERMVVVLGVSEDNAWASNVLVVDMLPAGFEIDNPRLVDSADITSLPWLGDDTTPAHTEFRDDRFVAAYERDEQSPRSFTLAYMVRAVSPGSFAHPPAMVEDMYRPHLSARTESGRVEVFGPRP